MSNKTVSKCLRNGMDFVKTVLVIKGVVLQTKDITMAVGSGI